MELDHFAQDANEMPHVLDTHVLHDRVHVLVAQTSALAAKRSPSSVRLTDTAR